MAGGGKSQHHEADSPPEILHVSDGVLAIADYVGASYVYPDVDGVLGQTAYPSSLPVVHTIHVHSFKYGGKFSRTKDSNHSGFFAPRNYV